MAADLDLLGRGVSGQDAEIERIQRGPVIGGDGEDLAQDIPGPGGGPAVDHRAIHQEEGLRDRAQDILVGDGRVDSEESLERDARAAAPHEAAAFFPAGTGRPAASAAFLPATLVLACEMLRAAALVSPRLTGAFLAWALARALLFWAGTIEIALGVQG